MKLLLNFGHAALVVLDAIGLPGEHSLHFRLEGALGGAFVVDGSLELVDFALEVLILLESESLDGFDKVQPFVCCLVGLIFVEGEDEDPVLLSLAAELAEHEELMIQFCLVLVIQLLLIGHDRLINL